MQYSPGGKKKGRNGPQAIKIPNMRWKMGNNGACCIHVYVTQHTEAGAQAQGMAGTAVV
jgi:hypothetical protein